MPFHRDNYGIDVNFMNLIAGIVLYANFYINIKLRRKPRRRSWSWHFLRLKMKCTIWGGTPKRWCFNCIFSGVIGAEQKISLFCAGVDEYVERSVFRGLAGVDYNDHSPGPGRTFYFLGCLNKPPLSFAPPTLPFSPRSAGVKDDPVSSLLSRTNLVRNEPQGFS